MAVPNVPAELVAVQPGPLHERAQPMATTYTPPVITLSGKSRNAYQFQVYPWGQAFNSVGAVYAVLKLLHNGNYEIIYVGQTADLAERFDAHHKASCFQARGRTHLGVHRRDDEAGRLAIEADLLGAYTPPCNG